MKPVKRDTGGEHLPSSPSRLSYIHGAASLASPRAWPSASFLMIAQLPPCSKSAGSEAQLDTPQPPPGDDWNLSAPEGLTGDATNGPGILRGNDAVRQMTSWKEMAQWLLEYNNYDYLKPTEISRMWTQIVHVRLPHLHSVHPQACSPACFQRQIRPPTLTNPFAPTWQDVLSPCPRRRCMLRVVSSVANVQHAEHTTRSDLLSTPVLAP